MSKKINPHLFVQYKESNIDTILTLYKWIFFSKLEKDWWPCEPSVYLDIIMTDHTIKTKYYSINSSKK